MTEILRLMRLMTGDEKHDAAATSTLDVIRVLYERVLDVSPETVGDPHRDRFYLSKGHGPMAYYAVLADQGLLPRVLAGRLGRVRLAARLPPGPQPGARASRSPRARSGTASRSRSARALGLRAQGIDVPRRRPRRRRRARRGQQPRGARARGRARAGRAHRRRGRQPVLAATPCRAGSRSGSWSRAGTPSASTVATTTSSRRHCRTGPSAGPTSSSPRWRTDEPQDPVRADRRRPRRDRPVGRAGVRGDLRPVLRRGRGRGTPTG